FTIISNRENEYRAKVGTIICDSLRKIGIDARLSMIDFNTLVVRIADTYDYEACLLGLTGGIEPVGGMNVYLSSGRTHQWYPNQPKPATPAEARIDELMNKYLKEPVYEKQREYFNEVQRIMAEEQFMIYTVVPYSYVAVRNKFGNLKPTVLDHRLVLWNCEELFVRLTP
ncbi:ABC transporter substrate-binding protein, partial [Candidatus Sumerlaeota bacterium]|nr:ABC transporter substrate-binding protein [Candidatus Sumerlaeota bacterium]